MVQKERRLLARLQITSQQNCETQKCGPEGQHGLLAYSWRQRCVGHNLALMSKFHFGIIRLRPLEWLLGRLKMMFLWSVLLPIIPIKNLTSLFPLIFLSKHISLHALGRIKWVLDIIWPLNQYFNLKNQTNWIKQVLMLSFLIGIICILLHRPKKLTLTQKWYFVTKIVLTYCEKKLF